MTQNEDQQYSQFDNTSFFNSTKDFQKQFDGPNGNPEMMIAGDVTSVVSSNYPNILKIGTKDYQQIRDQIYNKEVNQQEILAGLTEVA